MFLIRRHMVDEDGDQMVGYLNPTGQYGPRREAFEYEAYNEASDDLRIEEGYFNQEFPNDINSFKIVETD